MSTADVQLWFTEATEAGCRIYAEWPARLSAGGESTAWLHGPESAYAATLKARYPLGRRAGPSGAAAEAWIDEPCFWTPVGPYVYRWEVRFSAPAEAASGILGIRRLSVRRDYLEFDLRRWVLRGARAAEPLLVDLWHEAQLTALVESPSDDFCERASHRGVLIVARVPPGVDAAAELRRLSAWPAVGVAILAASETADLSREAPNLILAQSIPAGGELRPAAWARLLFCEVDEPADFARRVAGFGQPIVAVRKDQEWSMPTEARAACDRLQRDLAAAGVQMAGYLV